MRYTFHSAVTATGVTNGAGVNVAALKSITIQIIAASISSGNCVFTFQGSNNGVDWDGIPVIRSIANAVTEGLTRDLTITLSSNTNEVVALDPSYIPEFIRVNLNVTTDGSYTVLLHGHER